MRKLIALLVVLACGVVFAQHTDVVNQIGNQNFTDIDQYFVGSGTSFDGNEAYVDQIGDYNYSDVYQDNNGFAGSAEFADIWQQGNYNSADIDQFNDGHDGYITQLGNNNDADIFQRQNKTDANIYQQGNSNTGNSKLFGVGNTWTNVIQVGNQNVADQDLGTGVGMLVEDSWFQAQQYGSYNYARQFVDGDGFAGSVDADLNTGDIYQSGNYNYGYQEMRNDAGIIAAYNTAVITQLNNNNTAKQWMKRDNNTSNIFQNGNSNEAYSTQN